MLQGPMKIHIIAESIGVLCYDYPLTTMGGAPEYK